MADIAASDLTYTEIKRRVIAPSQERMNTMEVAFGDGTLTYPSGGVPLTKAKLGLPTVIQSLNIDDPEAANGLIYKYDSANEKLRIYEVDSSLSGDQSLVELDSGSDAPAAATLRLTAIGW